MQNNNSEKEREILFDEWQQGSDEVCGWKSKVE